MQISAAQTQAKEPKTANASTSDCAEVAEIFLLDGFRLASFIVRDRSAALEILTSAVSKMSSQRAREKKRHYWRDKSLKRKITRIVREDIDGLQWLIYSESTRFEVQQEAKGLQSPRDLIIRYVKYLVQATTAMSSFYVCVGIQRLLYNYSTVEAQKTYEWLTEHYPCGEAYRTVKGTLMKQMEDRFGDLISTCKGPYREQRFEVLEEQSIWIDLVKECLDYFVPWSTRADCLASRETEFIAGVRSLNSRLSHVDQDVIETQRCHVFLDPRCYGGLTQKVNLERPFERLAIPKLYASPPHENGTGGGSNGGDLELTKEEIEKIRKRLSEENAARREISPRSLVIVSDEIQRARVDVAGAGRKACCELKDGTKIIEIWAESEGKKVLLATHWIAYTALGDVVPATASVEIGGNRELVLRIDAVPGSNDLMRRISLALECRPVSALAAWKESIKIPSQPLSIFPKFAFAMVILLCVGLALRVLHDHRQGLLQQATIERAAKELAQEKSLSASLQERLTKESVSQASKYGLMPDEFRARGPKVEDPIVTIDSHTDLVLLELPIVNNQQSSYRVVLKTFLGNKEILAEGSLSPMQANGLPAVNFAIPMMLLHDKQRYVLEVRPSSAQPEEAPLHTYTFKALKK